MQNTVQNTFQGQNNFTHPGNNFSGAFNGTFYGSGTSLTGIPTFAGNNIFTGVNQFTNAGNIFYGSGANLTGINPANIVSGTFPSAITLNLNAGIILNGTFSGGFNFTGGNFTSGIFNFVGIPFFGGVANWGGVQLQGGQYGVAGDPGQFYGTFQGSGAGAFVGDGSMLTGIGAVGGNNTWTGINDFTNADSRFAGIAASATEAESFTGLLEGDVTGPQGATVISSVPAASIKPGTLGAGVVGTNLTELNATQLTQGTIPVGRIQYAAGIAEIADGDSSVVVNFPTDIFATAVGIDFTVTLCIDLGNSADVYFDALCVNNKVVSGATTSFTINIANPTDQAVPVGWSVWAPANDS